MSKNRRGVAEDVAEEVVTKSTDKKMDEYGLGEAPAVSDLKKVGMKNESLWVTSGPEYDSLWDSLEKLSVGNKARAKKRQNKDELARIETEMYFGVDGVSLPVVNAGDIVSGKVKGIVNRDLVIDIGYKDDVFVNIKANENYLVEGLHVGDEIKVFITNVIDKPYEIRGSLSEIARQNADSQLREFFRDDIAFEATIIGIVPAGFNVDINFGNFLIHAFMPKTLAGANKLTEKQMNDLVGKTVPVMMESFQKDVDKGMYVVSRRKYLKSLENQKVQDLVIGDYYKGTVTGTIDFGVFVEFNECLTGMIHEVNLSEETKESHVKEGDEIEFFLRDIYTTRDGYKLILSQVKRASLWDSIKNGMVLKSKVISVKNFGVLVSLDEETTGLIQTPYLKKLDSQPKKGDEINVKVINVYKDDRKIFLDVVK